MSNNQTTAIANLIAIDEQLFTEVTPEQAAIVEGGLRVQLTQLTCLQAGADGGGSEEVWVSYLTDKPPAVPANAVNGPDVTLASPTSMSAGSVKNISSLSSSSNSGVTVNFFDKDGSTEIGSDFLGQFFVGRAGSNQSRTISGSGSTYRVTFNAF